MMGRGNILQDRKDLVDFAVLGIEAIPEILKVKIGRREMESSQEERRGLRGHDTPLNIPQVCRQGC